MASPDGHLPNKLMLEVNYFFFFRFPFQNQVSFLFQLKKNEEQETVTNAIKTLAVPHLIHVHISLVFNITLCGCWNDFCRNGIQCPKHWQKKQHGSL